MKGLDEELCNSPIYLSLCKKIRESEQSMFNWIAKSIIWSKAFTMLTFSHFSQDLVKT